jgi:hypothetical protein
MPYNYNIPQPTDQLSVSQNGLLQNFTALGVIAGNTQLASASLAAAGSAGFNFVYFNSGGLSFPPITFPTNNVALFSATNTNSPAYPTDTGLTELFVNKQNFGSVADQIPFTASILGTATPGNASSGWSYLPSGVIIQWAANQSVAAGGLFTFPIAFPNACFSAVVSQNVASAGSATVYLSVGSLTKTNCWVGARSPCFYNIFAIGY